MKSQFLKIAGVKTDQEFYKLFPSEASFFKKHPEAKQYIQKAQNGADVNGNGIPDLLEEYQDPINQRQNFDNFDTPEKYQALNPISKSRNTGIYQHFNQTQQLPSLTLAGIKSNFNFTDPKDLRKELLSTNSPGPKMSMLDKMRGTKGLLDAGVGVIQGFQMLEEGKKAKKEANQFNEYSKVALMASQTRPEEIKRKYNRPEDNIITGNELFPIYGVGTNVLAKNGLEIAQKGKSIKPVYVSSKNDPRYRAYQDSLSIYNEGIQKYNSIKKTGKMKGTDINVDSEKKYSFKEYMDEYNRPDSDFNIFNTGTNSNMKPIKVSQFRGKGILGYLDYGRQAQYKKPTQPVQVRPNIFKDDRDNIVTTGDNKPTGKPQPVQVLQKLEDELREKLTPLQRLETKGIIPFNQEINTPKITIRPQAQIPKYWNVTDKVNQNFGGSESNYKFYPQNGESLRELSQKKYEDGTPYNSRSMTPVFENGGYIPIAEDGYELTDGDYSNFGAMGSQLYTGLTGSQNSGGSKIGSSVGTLAGTAIGGPIGGAIGGFLGTVAGDLLDSSGRQTKKYQKSAQRNINEMMFNQSIQGLQNQNASYMKDGGEISQLEESGQLETMWGGDVQPLSQNPYSGETIIFKGQSHSQTDSQGNSGIGINYGNNPVEVERGEPASVLTNSKTGEENLVIFGNLKIPQFAHDILQDPKAKNKKFKNYVADLSKEENKLNKLIQISEKNLQSINTNDSSDKILLQTAQTKLLGSQMKLKDIANKKQSLSEFQNIINDTAEKHGFKADDLARGKITKNKNSLTKNISQDGTSISDTETMYNPYLHKEVLIKSSPIEYRLGLPARNPNTSASNPEEKNLGIIQMDNIEDYDTLKDYENYDDMPKRDPNKRSEVAEKYFDRTGKIAHSIMSEDYKNITPETEKRWEKVHKGGVRKNGGDVLKEAMYGYAIPKAKQGYSTTEDPGKKIRTGVSAIEMPSYVQSGNNNGYFSNMTDENVQRFKDRNRDFYLEGGIDIDNVNFKSTLNPKYNPKNKKSKEPKWIGSPSLLKVQEYYNKKRDEYQAKLPNGSLEVPRAHVDGKMGINTNSIDSSLIYQKPFFSNEIDISEADKTKLSSTNKKEKKEANRPIIKYKRNEYMDAFNQVLPFLRPSNATELDGNQLLGEMYGMSNNQLEPVQSQNYRPELRTPYDISYQDQLNEVTAGQRAAQRATMNSPEVQGDIAAQAYQNKSKILADQFRANQAMKEGVYNQNIQTLNDAQLKNLAINDTQYTRQEQAKSNTKAINQAILNSVSSKYQQNKLENRTLGIQENMYNYRFDKSGRAINLNGFYQPNVNQSNYTFDENGIATHENVFNSKGDLVGQRALKNYSEKEDVVEDTEEIIPIQFKQKQFDPLNLKINNKNSAIAKYGKIISNSSIVKSLK